MPPSDFGLYAGLIASPNYDTRRKDAAGNMVIAERMRNDAVLQMQERMKSMGIISEYLNKSAEIENNLLPNDAERVIAKDNELRKDFIGQLQQYNNDPMMFMMMGGNAAMDKYARDLSGSEELRTGIENKKNFQLGTDALMKRQLITPVEVEYPGGTKQTVSWTEALDLFNQNVIKKLPFKSSAAMLDFNPLEFAKIERPDSEAKYKGFVSMEALESKLRAENPTLTDEEIRTQAEVYRHDTVAGATVIPWGRRLPHGSGGYGMQWQNYQDKLVLAKNAVDMLHRGLFDPSYRADYNAKVGGYALTNSPIDLSKIKESSETHAGAANGLYVRNDPSDPSKSVYIITFDGGGKKELTLDDMLKQYPPPGLQTDDVTRILMYVNRDGSALYNPMKWATTMPQGTPFSGTDQSAKISGLSPPSGPNMFTQFLPPGTQQLAPQMRRKDFSYWNSGGSGGGAMDAARQWLDSQGYESDDASVQTFLQNNPNFGK